MSDWDAMLEMDDAELVSEITADRGAYAIHNSAGNVAACTDIKNKYGLMGHSPDQVLEQLRQMTLPIGGGQ